MRPLSRVSSRAWIFGQAVFQVPSRVIAGDCLTSSLSIPCCKMGGWYYQIHSVQIKISETPDTRIGYSARNIERVQKVSQREFCNKLQTTLPWFWEARFKNCRLQGTFGWVWERLFKCQLWSATCFIDEKNKASNSSGLLELVQLVC